MVAPKLSRRDALRAGVAEASSSIHRRPSSPMSLFNWRLQLARRRRFVGLKEGASNQANAFHLKIVRPSVRSPAPITRPVAARVGARQKTKWADINSTRGAQVAAVGSFNRPCSVRWGAREGTKWKAFARSLAPVRRFSLSPAMCNFRATTTAAAAAAGR